MTLMTSLNCQFNIVNACDARLPKSPVGIFHSKVLKICSLKRNFQVIFQLETMFTTISIPSKHANYFYAILKHKRMQE